jgi:hypothetical protein
VTPKPRYFFIIGAMKAGTTSLYKYLAGHPDVYASPRKEPRVFRDPRDAAELKTEFEALFVGHRGESWCFEASTAYTKYPFVSGVPERLRSVVPDAKFVYLVRNPVERAWSQYVHNLAHGRETGLFTEVITERPEYLDISRYHLQLTQYLDVFQRDQLLVLVFEEMIRNPTATVRTVCEFLGIDATYTPPTGDVAFNASRNKLAASGPLRAIRALGLENVTPGRVLRRFKQAGTELPEMKSALSLELRSMIADSLRPDTEAFFQVLGRRVPAWADFV